METLTIDRGQWLTGTARNVLGDSTLRDPESGLKCCLGFYGTQLGFSDTRMDGRSTLSALSGLDIPAWLGETCELPGTAKGHRVEDALVETNDNSHLHPIRREARIAKLFERYGDIKVKFVGKYQTATAAAREAIRS